MRSWTRTGVLALGAVLAAAVVPGTAYGAQPGDGVPLRDAVAQLVVAEEVRDGYEREKFKHWTDQDKDGCSTRAEVLLAEAVTAPERGPRCALSGGRWYSAYDDLYIEEARRLDIDHMVPLAEAWDSGASGWTPRRREAYANDLGDASALIAVTGTTNRSKADQDPAQWLPPCRAAMCWYISEWTRVKTRWGLSVDAAEKKVLTEAAAACPNIPIAVEAGQPG